MPGLGMHGDADLGGLLSCRFGVGKRVKIDLRMFLDEVDHALARPGRGEIDLGIGEFYLGRAVQCHRHMMDDVFGDLDHRRKIDIGLIKFERGEFRVMPRA